MLHSLNCPFQLCVQCSIQVEFFKPFQPKRGFKCRTKDSSISIVDRAANVNRGKAEVCCNKEYEDVTFILMTFIITTPNGECCHADFKIPNVSVATLCVRY